MTTYKEAGVDVNKNDVLVEMIKGMTGIGTGFADTQMLGNQFMATSCDGVGTKIKLAKRFDGIYDTIGQDLVGMCANDLVCSGAAPAFFLDYIGMNSLDNATIARVIQSVNSACVRFGMSLVGGEMAEMPGTYIKNLPELVGFAIGFGKSANALSSEDVEAGDKILGLSSSGPHSNGYSLINKVIENKEVSEEMLKNLVEPTRLYTGVNTIHQAAPFLIKSIAHITGGGLESNLKRVIPDGLGMDISHTWDIPEVFEYIAELGNVDSMTMNSTFNMGIGMCLIVEPKYVDTLVGAINDVEIQVIGEIIND